MLIISTLAECVSPFLVKSDHSVTFVPTFILRLAESSPSPIQPSAYRPSRRFFSPCFLLTAAPASASADYSAAPESLLAGHRQTEALPKLHFAPTKGRSTDDAAAKGPDFFTELRAEVSAYFTATGKSRHANAEMVIKTIALLTVYLGTYALILTSGWSLGVLWALCVVMGIAMAGIGFAVAHDAVHGAYSANATVNRLIGYTMNLVGGSSYVWSITHNVVHHTYTNIPDYDEDLEVAPILRLSRSAPWWPIHRYQHLFGWLLYGFATIFWVFVKDYRKLLKPNIGPYENKRHPLREVAITIIGKLLYYAYMIVLPLLVLDITWWQFAIGFVTLQFTAGLILGVVFQLAHVVEGPEQPTGDATGRLSRTWAEHQLATTADFDRHNRWLSWYVGGLNFQVVHHLFPKVCSVHYPALSPIVERVAARHGLTYHIQPSFATAVRSHAQMLYQLGRNPNPRPVAAQVAGCERRLSPR